MVSTLSLGLLFLRLGLGVVFLAHGLQKTLGLFGGPGIEGMSKMLAGLGFSLATPFAWIVGLGEFLGGLCILLGIFPRISASIIAIIMLVAIFKVHLKNGFFAMGGGFEYPFLILFCCLCLIITGSGKLSLFDRF
jgi:putative oxidoreductase